MSEVLKQAVAPHVYNHSTEENNPKQKHQILQQVN